MGADTSVVTRYAKNGVVVEFHKLPAAKVRGDKLCGACASLTGEAINTLLNYILNAGVVGGCSKLCSNLKTKAEVTVCTLACAVVGIKEFVKAIEKADLDPIYLCDLLKICPIDDNGEGKIASLDVSPASAAQGTTFNAALQVTVTNHTGAGEFQFDIEGGAQPSAGASSVYPELAPGSYGVKLQIPTKPSEDPTQGPSWMPGSYTVKSAFCMGE